MNRRCCMASIDPAARQPPMNAAFKEGGKQNARREAGRSCFQGINEKGRGPAPINIWRAPEPERPS